MTKSNENDESKRESIFEIMDGIMFQLNNTKKTFLIMILSILIVPAIVLFASAVLLDISPQDIMNIRLQKQLENGEISQEEFKQLKENISNGINSFIFPPHILIIIISLIWLGVGIRQWIKLSRWDKKYQRFKQQQNKIDEDFNDTSKE